MAGRYPRMLTIRESLPAMTAVMRVLAGALGAVWVCLILVTRSH